MDELQLSRTCYNNEVISPDDVIVNNGQWTRPEQV